MAEETNQNADQTTDAPEADAAASAPEVEAAPQAPEAPAQTQSAPSAPAAQADPQEVLVPKDRRRRRRAARTAKVTPGGPRSAEQRQAERVELRARKAHERRTGRAHAKAKAKAKATPEGPGPTRPSTPPREHAPGVQKVRQGVVVSDKADKTITVRIDVARRHRRYQKIVRTSSTLHAHDERNDAHIGDTVIVREARPLSRSKRWRLVSVLERAR